MIAHTVLEKSRTNCC